MSSASDSSEWLCPTLFKLDDAPVVQEASQLSRSAVKQPTEAKPPTDDETSLLTIREALFLRKSILHECFFLLLCIMTGGLFLIVVRWFPMWEAKLRYKRSRAFALETDFVCCTSLDGIQTICPILSIDPLQRNADWVPIGHVRARYRHLGSSWGLQQSDHNIDSASGSSYQTKPSSDSQSNSEINGFPLPRMFVWRHERFWYDADTMSYSRRGFHLKLPYDAIHKRAAEEAYQTWVDAALPPMKNRPVASSAFADDKQLRSYIRSMSYGRNVIDVKPKSLPMLVLDEAMKPFFMFQVFSMTVWYFQNYVIYAYTILGLSVTAVMHTSIITWQNMRNLQKVVEADYPVIGVELSSKEATGPLSPAIPARILGVNVPETPSLLPKTLGPRPWSPLPTFRRKVLSSKDLMPGDIVEITGNMTFPCDLVLLSGTVVVNESMLTGESAPVQKTPLPYGFASAQSSILNTRSDKDSKFILFSGTRVVQAKPQGALPCNPLIQDSDFKKSGPHVYAPESVWQFSMEQSADALRRYLQAAGVRPGEIDEKVSIFMASFRSRERSLPVLGMVARTGFNTAKGQLVRSILFPKPSKFDFDRQVIRFILVLAFALFTGCIVTVGYAIEQNEDLLAAFLNCLNLVTITIPPALPLALSIAVSAAFVELQNKRIFCINPNRIVAAGRVNVLCFDKTGTLTEDGLTLKGVQIVQASLSSSDLIVSPVQSDLQQLYMDTLTELDRKFFAPNQKVQTNSKDTISLSNIAMSHTLAACHSLALLEKDDSDDEDEEDDHGQSKNQKGQSAGDSLLPQTESPGPGQSKVNNFVGDPLEVQMFLNTNWAFLTRPRRIQESTSQVWSLPHIPSFVDTILFPPVEEKSSQALAIIKRYDFDSEIRRMGTLVYHIPLHAQPDWTPEFSLLVKGAPENIKQICRPDTIPAEFESNMQKLALSGYRILACAYKPLTVDLAESGMDEERAMKNKIKALLSTPRSDMEQNLIFTGFLVMENSLKPETIGALEDFVHSGLRCIMVTGDNPLTAFAVARKCDPFFLRTSRKAFLLDVCDEPSGGSALVIQDLLDPNNRCDFASYLKAKSHPRNVIHSRGEKVSASPQIGLSDVTSLQNSVDDTFKEIDVVVTGSAFSYLQAEHDELMEHKLSNISSVKRKPGFLKRFFQSQHVDANDLLPLTPYQVVLTRANIFARMTPRNKQDLMGGLQDLSFAVCMTGDGANDSGALKAADVGLSIQAKKVENEEDISAGSTPSIAAPFSTPKHHIGAVTDVLLEGRCCIVSTFAMFRFMFCYGLIQFTSVVVLYRYILELGDYQYLWADLGLVFPLAIAMPMIKSRKTLSRGRPESDLVSATVFRSVFGFAVLIVGFQIFANEYLHTTSGYVEPTDDTDSIDNQDTTESFLFSNFQYSSVGLALSQSFGVFRQSLHVNPLLSLVLIAQFVMNSWLLVE
eukprot:TRINITY_DN6050_c0_g1_i2.p1 TRINITY_DN6050_c0_g1~~TRINITY_DN6050_c0_g1_i2.p1  ORF type:complete len:1443 (+),score=311.35 TRINITY_DN6050_c0_g1_i2:49-4377(+)